MSVCVCVREVKLYVTHDTHTTCSCTERAGGQASVVVSGGSGVPAQGEGGCV